MKRTLALLLTLLLLSLCACASSAAPEEDKTTDSAERQTLSFPFPETLADVTETTDYVTDVWVAIDIPFKASKKIRNITDATMDVTFTNRESGTSLVMPAFWDGDVNWIVRFAPTEHGVWDYTVSCAGKTDLGLNGKTGTLAANSYKGDLAIYKRGFVKTEEGKRYFVYDDGTPFFYLGDTHWAMLQEEFSSAGRNNAGIQTDSHFKYIVDRRVAQGFTVYQSEPIGRSFDAMDGITSADIKGFQTCDAYFAYIAEKGLVHANAELLFPSEASKEFINDDDFLYAITRYWVARYAAYPVLWTLGQEIDNDYFGRLFTVTNNPYVKMCRVIYEVDPYRHPITGHQENAMICGAAGKSVSYDYGTGADRTEKKQADATMHVSEASAFYGMKEHTWWGVQWRPDIDRQYNFFIPRDYWLRGEGKVAINYETRYDYLYTKNFGARANGWISFLCGMYGYGYGAADIWCYKSTYSFDTDHFDGVDTVTQKDKTMPWGEAVLMPTGDQLTYMRGFLEAAGWWKLEPDFDFAQAFQSLDVKDGYYVAAHDGNNVYVVYLYNRTTGSAGALVQMDADATYTAQWFNPRTGVYTLIDTAIRPQTVTGVNTPAYDIPEKPEADDMVLLVTKN